jgi:pyruvate carboxylase subunit B
MTFDVEIGGRVRRVSIEPLGHADSTGGRFYIGIEDPSFSSPAPRWVVDARRTDLGWLLSDERDGRVVDAAVTERPRGDLLVQLPHVSVEALVDGRRFRRPGVHSGAAGPAEHVLAPMPGRIVRVLVAVGDDVTAGQGLVVVEAMKMENALTASRPARVAEIAIAEGQSVEAGRLLVRLE